MQGKTQESFLNVFHFIVNNGWTIDNGWTVDMSEKTVDKPGWTVGKPKTF